MSFDKPESIASTTALDEAAADNLIVSLPGDQDLQVDIDSDKAYAHFMKMIEVVRRFMTAVVVKDEPSRSGLPKRHILVRLGEDVTPLERIALQAILGSDRKREFFGFMRIRQNDPHPTLFLERNPNVRKPK